MRLEARLRAMEQRSPTPGVCRCSVPSVIDYRDSIGPLAPGGGEALPPCRRCGLPPAIAIVAVDLAAQEALHDAKHA
jgi:hypothetical protein